MRRFKGQLLMAMLGLTTFLIVPVLANAETETITAEASYIMGDGETPAFAEAMVLQKAKQAALEQAGTHVESYTRLINLDLTVDEIATVADGVMKTEVIERKRALEGDGVRFRIKIRAMITTHKIEDLARRVKGGNVAAEYKKLQDQFAKLTKDLDVLKRQIAKTKTESEREGALDKIREVEKQFREVRSTDTAFHKRLVSGQELSAMVLQQLRDEPRRRHEEQRQQDRQQQALEQLLRTIRQNGHTIEIGPPVIKVSPDRPETVAFRFLVTAKVSEEAKAAIRDLRKAYDGEPGVPVIGRIEEVLNSLTLVLTVVLKDGSEYVTRQNGFHNYRSPRSYDLKRMAHDTPRTDHFSVDIPRHLIGEVNFVEGHILPATAS